MGNGEIFSDFTICRILIVLGIGRAITGRFFSFSLKNSIDCWALLFAFASVLSAFGHDWSSGNPWTYRAGLVWSFIGTYLYGRCYMPDLSAAIRMAQVVPFVLGPLAVGMTLEKAAHHNYYYLLGANTQTPVTRDGKVRAQGPFRHAILAGCAGATSLPFAYLLWRTRRRVSASACAASCVAIVLSCSSSGPLAAVGVTVAAASLWRFRTKLSYFRWGSVLLGLLYWLIKGRGPWYIMASIDLVGGSTGWHRAKLMDQGWTFLSEWWLCGTDYTRHWMSSGVSWSPNHVDMTNFYLHLGVIGGLPLAGCLIAMLVTGFGHLGKYMAALRVQRSHDEIIYWCFGAVLAAHAISFVSISYFDQMYTMLFATLAAIAGMTAQPIRQTVVRKASATDLHRLPPLRQ